MTFLQGGKKAVFPDSSVFNTRQTKKTRKTTLHLPLVLTSDKIVEGRHYFYGIIPVLQTRTDYKNRLRFQILFVQSALLRQHIKLGAVCRLEESTSIGTVEIFKPKIKVSS